MISLLILILQIISFIALIRLNKCGKVVVVKEEHTYIPQTKVKKVVKKVEIPDEDED